MNRKNKGILLFVIFALFVANHSARFVAFRHHRTSRP
jgi:hypothetical protein